MAEKGSLAKQRGAPVSVNGVVKRFGAFTAVDNVSLDIRAGEFLSLLGPSGSGKTTLLLMIAGFETPTEGTIDIGGRRVDQLNPEKRNVGMVFQNYALFPHMTIEQNVAFPLRMRRMPYQDIEPRVRDVLELVHLSEQAKKYPLQLSGGQQQRVALARALVYEPSVLLMDEPLGALDRRLRAMVQLELIELHHSVEATIIYVTHDQEEALAMSDRIAVLNSGRILQVGTPKEVYENPTDPFVADFVGDSTLLPGEVRTVDSYSCSVAVGEGLIVRGRATAGLKVGAQVHLMIRPEKATISSEQQGASLAGVLTEVQYLGSSTRYRVQLDAGPTILGCAYNCASQESHEIGERVFVAWHPEDVIALRS